MIGKLPASERASRLTPALLLAFVAAWPADAACQRSLAYLAVREQGVAAGEPRERNQLAFELGYVSAGLSLARRLESAPLGVGLGLWGSWEPPGTFDKNVWEPLGLFLFGRFAPTRWLHVDAGPTAARYLWADDCSDCGGTFIGLRSTVLVGYRFVHLGPEISVGRARDDRFGAEWGALYGGQIRLLLGWGG